MTQEHTLTKKDIIVVLGCIIILLANVATIGGGGRRRAKEALCLSNLRQWGGIWEMFLDDNAGRFMSGNEIIDLLDTSDPAYADFEIVPNAPYQTGICDEDHSWPAILWAYYRERKLLCCPTASKKPAGVGRYEVEKGMFSAWALWLDYQKDFIYGSYGVNLWVVDRPEHNEASLWRHITGHKRPKIIPVMLDAVWCEGFPQHREEPPATRYEYLAETGVYMTRFCVDRHDGATQGLFFDYSARKVGLKELWELKWHRQWNSGNDPAPEWPEWMANFRDYPRGED